MSLVIRNVSRDFEVRGRAPVRAVVDLSLEVERGEFCTLLGPSGCGKTTLLRLIAGFDQPTAGEIVHNGRPLNDVPPYRRGFPMVFQSYALFPHMSVADNVAYGLRIRNTPAADLAQRVADVLALLGLQDQQDRHPSQISGGQQQRVALARALVLEPEIILLDEPLSNLDAGLRVSMRSEIRALQKRLGITAIYVTHDQEEALAVSDRVVVMNAGRIEQIGTPADVFHRPHTEFVARFMGATNIVRVEPAGTGRLRVLGHDYPIAATGDSPTHAVIRSDAIDFADHRPLHEATVTDVSFLGARIEYTLRLGEGILLSVERSSSDSAFAVGQQVGFRLVPERIHLVRSGIVGSARQSQL